MFKLQQLWKRKLLQRRREKLKVARTKKKVERKRRKQKKTRNLRRKQKREVVRELRERCFFWRTWVIADIERMF